MLRNVKCRSGLNLAQQSSTIYSLISFIHPPTQSVGPSVSHQRARALLRSQRSCPSPPVFNEVGQAPVTSVRVLMAPSPRGKDPPRRMSTTNTSAKGQTGEAWSGSLFQVPGACEGSHNLTGPRPSRPPSSACSCFPDQPLHEIPYLDPTPSPKPPTPTQSSFLRAKL